MLFIPSSEKKRQKKYKMDVDFKNKGTVEVIVEAGVSRIEFSHPQSNSLPSALLKKLTQAIEQESSNLESQIILLGSSGDRVFCGGASFDELASISNEKEGLSFFSGFANVINAMRKSPKIIVGRIQGKAVGGGVGLASAVDYCFATDYAGIKLSELAVGIGPFVVGPAVERKIGKSAMSQLAIDATQFRTAEWAFNKGLYSQVYPTIESMDQGISELLKSLTYQSASAQTALKKMLWEDFDHWDELLVSRALISGKLVLTEESKASIQLILEKKNQIDK